MPKSFPRSRRIADELQRELAQLIRTEVKDPRIGLITLTDVVVSPDLSHAKIFVTSLGEAAALTGCLEGLRHAAGFLRVALSHRLKLRSVPELHFVYDESVERGVHLSHLIDDAVKTAKDGEA
jgi:ribosome-binding factor A